MYFDEVNHGSGKYVIKEVNRIMLNSILLFFLGASSMVMADWIAKLPRPAGL